MTANMLSNPFAAFYYRKGYAPETVGVVNPHLFISSFKIHK